VTVSSNNNHTPGS